jgi:hypothetical protein
MPLTPHARARLHATIAVAGTGFLFWRFQGPLSLTLFVLASAFAILAWLAPRRYLPVQRAFDFLIHAFLAAFTWTVLALVYFGLFTPLRFVRTLTHRDPLALRRPPAHDSYLTPLPATSPRFDRQF